MQGRPLGNRALIRPIPEDDVSAGGIIIPDMAKNRPQIGVVEAVGQGQRVIKGKDVEVHPLDVKPGDVVLYSRYAGIDIRLGDDEAVVLGGDDILFVLDVKDARAFVKKKEKAAA